MTVYEQKTKTHIPIPSRVDTSKHYTGIDHGATLFAPSAGRFVTTEPSGFFYDPTTTHTYNRTWKGAWLWSVRAAGMRSHSSHRYFFATTVLSFKPHLNLPRLQTHTPLFRPNASLQLHNQRSVSRSHRNDHAITTTPAHARHPPSLLELTRTCVLVPSGVVEITVPSAISCILVPSFIVVIFVPLTLIC